MQGSVTGADVECITFNVTKDDTNRFTMTQLPLNSSSELAVQDETTPAKMNIKVNASSDANFNVLITDYGKQSQMFILNSELTTLLHFRQFRRVFHL